MPPQPEAQHPQSQEVNGEGRGHSKGAKLEGTSAVARLPPMVSDRLIKSGADGHHGRPPQPRREPSQHRGQAANIGDRLKLVVMVPLPIDDDPRILGFHRGANHRITLGGVQRGVGQRRQRANEVHHLFAKAAVGIVINYQARLGVTVAAFF